MATYVFCGTTAALAGLIMTARTGSTVANAGVGMDFDSLIAAVLGGTSLFGGRGGTLRTIVGVLILGVLNNLLVLLNVPVRGAADRQGPGVPFGRVDGRLSAEEMSRKDRFCSWWGNANKYVGQNASIHAAA